MLDLADVRSYFFCVDVHKNAKHMLLVVVQTYIERPLDAHSVNNTWAYAKTTDIRYFLGLPSS
jgi:hypothetical protein